MSTPNGQANLDSLLASTIHLRKHAGSQFDPQGTEQFVERVAAGGFEPTAVEAPCVSPGPAS